MNDALNPSDDPLCGLLILDKPLKITSMGAVSRIRRRAGVPKVGHAGTLDPLATGVLVLAVGKATKSIPSLMDTDKQYRTEIDLSRWTPSGDLELEPEDIDVATPPSRDAIQAILETQFTGDIQQRPPLHSAVMIDGVRAYKRARRGEDVEVPPRAAYTYAMSIVAYEWPVLTLDVHCAKGFYVRSLALDLASALGTGGVCLSITRTAVGPFVLDAAHTLESLPERLQQSDLIDLDSMRTMLDAWSPPARA
ncbi:MAG: tRNA pseudouridine(55) synthase TruB [Planctomycetota bacterium]